jgi:hypothetical protein
MHTRFDTEARIAVTQAVDLARELGHREVGPDHLLLGLLANPRGAAYAALWDHGVHLDTARELVAERHVEPVPETDEGAEPETSAYEEDREALRAIGIDLDRVREAVRTHLGQDLADGWGGRPERRRGRRPERGRCRRRGRPGHPEHHEHHEHHKHPEHQEHQEYGSEHAEHGRGRRGPRSRRPDGPRFSRELRAVLRDVRRAVQRDRLEAAESGDRDAVRRVAGLTGARLLVALTRCDDEAVRAVLATAGSIDGLRAQAEAAVREPSA